MFLQALVILSVTINPKPIAPDTYNVTVKVSETVTENTKFEVESKPDFKATGKGWFIPAGYDHVLMQVRVTHVFKATKRAIRVRLNPHDKWKWASVVLLP